MSWVLRLVRSLAVALALLAYAIMAALIRRSNRSCKVFSEERS